MRFFLLIVICSLHIGFATAETDREVIWVDVRSWAENKFDSIEGDPNFPHQNIVEHVRQHYPDKSTPIRLYCARGGRAQSALELLSDAGYSNLQNAGGIDQVRTIRFKSSVKD